MCNGKSKGFVLSIDEEESRIIVTLLLLSTASVLQKIFYGNQNRREVDKESERRDRTRLREDKRILHPEMSKKKITT